MIKVYKRTADKPIKIGVFKSYVAFADWCDENPEQNIGTYDVIPSNASRGIASMDKIEYDGGLCTAERRGAI